MRCRCPGPWARAGFLEQNKDWDFHHEE
jgi:hypothetical protein